MKLNKLGHSKIEKLYTLLLILLIGIQPVLELVWLNDGTFGEIAGFTIPTLVRFGLVGAIGILSFFVVRFNKRYIWLAVYAIVVIIYAIFHNIYCTDFHSLIPGDFGYNWLQELFYLIRMLVPIAVIYFVYNSKITAKMFKMLAVGISLFSSLIIIITNITKTALGSYSDTRILGNIFDWFLNKGEYTFNDLASKGFFYWSIYSTVLVLLYPYLIYLYFKERKKRYLGLIALQGIALYMFGTKATTFSVVIELVTMLAVYVFCTLIKKDDKFSARLSIPLVAVILGAFIIFPSTPAISRIAFDKEYQKEIDAGEDKKGEDIEDIESYIAENYSELSIKEEFILDSYNYKYDPDFWQEILNELGPSQRMQNRIIEQRMLERVKEINNDPMDDYFGLGYTRTSNIYNLERDFLYQYYSLGIIGVILFLGPYIGILLIAMALMIIKFKEKGTVLNCSFVLGIGLSLFLAYYSGNVMDNLRITILLAFVTGYLLREICGKTERSEKAES